MIFSELDEEIDIEDELDEENQIRLDKELELFELMKELWAGTDDYKQERYDEEPVRQDSRLSTENKKILSKEEALRQIQLAKDRLNGITPSYQIKRRKEKMYV